MCNACAVEEVLKAFVWSERANCYSCCRMSNACAVGEVLKAFVWSERANCSTAGGPPRSRELAEICFFLSLGCQGMSSAAVVLIVYGAFVRFLNGLLTRMYNYSRGLHSPRTSQFHNIRYAVLKDSFCEQ